jgi:hypothetical protein
MRHGVLDKPTNCCFFCFLFSFFHLRKHDTDAPTEEPVREDTFAFDQRLKVLESSYKQIHIYVEMTLKLVAETSGHYKAILQQNNKDSDEQLNERVEIARSLYSSLSQV